MKTQRFLKSDDLNTFTVHNSLDMGNEKLTKSSVGGEKRSLLVTDCKFLLLLVYRKFE